MSSPTVYLVSGANRGIGLALVKALVSRYNDTIVFAGARNPTVAAELAELVQKFPGRVHIIKLTSCDKQDNNAAVKEIEKIEGRLDVVIANAGISAYYGPALTTPEDQLREHFNINVVGTHILFQATYPLLSKSTASPKFIPISSAAGSITDGASVPIGRIAYGCSKAAENYLACKLHFEHPKLTVFARERDPAMGSRPLISPEESATSVLNLVENSTREKDGATMPQRGIFIVIEGLDRSGKTTQTALLYDALKAAGIAVNQLKFPDRTTSIGKMIDSYLRSKSDLDDQAIHLLFSANRWEIASGIYALLNSGVSIVADRYAFSGVAFSASKGLSFEWCRSPDIGLPAPDLTIFLDVDPEVARTRGGYGEERYEKEEMQRRVRGWFKHIGAEMAGTEAAGGKWVTLNAGGEVDAVQQGIWDLVEPLVKRGFEEPVAKLWEEHISSQTRQ
ncbi:hypothetical protein HWV62_19545 [Athelia sp. TMB]|nr:hypothetical protein HWV62_19545 [Athelia sp. TMB]